MLVRVFPDIVFSPEVVTAPCGEKYVYPFRNILARFDSEMLPAELMKKIKTVEIAVGRAPRDKYLGRVIIDIDMIKYGEEVLRENDYAQKYVKELLERF